MEAKYQDYSILLVEDNEDLAFGLKNNFEIEGYSVTTVHSGEQALEKSLKNSYSLIVLDLMIPDRDGYNVLSTIRRNGVTSPVLVLSAKGEELDKIQCFRLGADDYVTKPFSTMELLFRIEAIIRRTNGNENGQTHIKEWVFDDIQVDQASRQVYKNGSTVSLTPMEFDLLVALLKREGAVARREELLQEVWGINGGIQSRTVDTHIAELRNKLEEQPSRPKHIKTAPKVGYRIET